jgi:hypothetical protein
VELVEEEVRHFGLLMFGLIGIYTGIHGDSNLVYTLIMRETRRDFVHMFTMGEVSTPLILIADIIRGERNRTRNRSPESA